jgi:hypothetical protein
MELEVKPSTASTNREAFVDRYTTLPDSSSTLNDVEILKQSMTSVEDNVVNERRLLST